MPATLRACVIDTNVLIDLQHGGIVSALFGLPIYPMTTDFLLDELPHNLQAQLQRHGLVFAELSEAVDPETNERSDWLAVEHSNSLDTGRRSQQPDIHQVARTCFDSSRRGGRLQASNLLERPPSPKVWRTAQPRQVPLSVSVRRYCQFYHCAGTQRQP